jgi:xanthine dehydrogenase accessory factor
VPAHLAALCKQLAQSAGVLVRVYSVQGSGPREVGAWMAVFADSLVNTIGGGHLEHQACALARAWLQTPERTPSGQPGQEQVVRFALGPSLGQCCGGVVLLSFEHIAAADTSRLQQSLRPTLQPLALFGGGHVGRALVQALAPLPFAVRWVDSRDEIFPDDVPSAVHCEHSDPVQAVVRELAPLSDVLIMSFSHAEDLDVVATCLQRQRERADLGFIGLIGSKSKWASFRSRLRERGFSDAELERITCPIGVPGIQGKAPEVVAIAVAAQLLQQHP